MRESHIDLDKLAAYVKFHPIRKKEDMLPDMLSWNPMDEDWDNTLKSVNPFWYTGHKGSINQTVSRFTSDLNAGKKQLKKVLELRDRLLGIGGNQAVMDFYEEDLDKIMVRGQLWYGDRIKMMKGQNSRCHQNSCLLWKENKEELRIATGYALTEDGGWRQHSWCIWLKPKKNIIVETTVKRIAYFGYVMTEEECENFCYEN